MRIWKNIFEYIAKDSKYYAKIHVQKIKSNVVLLKENPRLCRIAPEIQDENIREIIFENYRIIYEIINDDRIDILTIYHSARILKSLN